MMATRLASNTICVDLQGNLNSKNTTTDRLNEKSTYITFGFWKVAGSTIRRSLCEYTSRNLPTCFLIHPSSGNYHPPVLTLSSVPMSMREETSKEEDSAYDVRAFLERHPSRPWTSENLSQVLQELLAFDVVGDDSDSSFEASAFDDSDLGILQNYGGVGFGQESRLSRISRSHIDSKQLRSNRKRSSKKGKNRSSKDLKHSISLDATTSSEHSDSKKIKSRDDSRAKVKKSLDLSSGKLKKTSISSKIKGSEQRDEIQVTSLKVKDSQLIDLGKISSRLIKKHKPEPIKEKEDLPTKIIPRVSEMVNAIKTAMKYNLQPENFRDEDELEEKMELNRLLKSYRSELDSSGVKEVSKSQYKGSFIKGIPTFRYVPLQPKKEHSEEKREVCNCKTCKMNRLWVETKHRRADELVPFLGEPRKTENVKNVWNCQCKGPQPGFKNKNQMVMKIRIPHSMRPDELKKLNSVPRMEIYKHITPAVNGKVNIKNAVINKPQQSRPIIQQEMMCHMNEMRCVLLPPPFTGKVTKFETPDWVVEYNKRYIYDYFFQQSKNIPNVSFMHFSYKKNLAVLTEEIIQGCMNRTDIFDDDTCQCTFLCKCAHKTIRKPNATLFDTVRQAKKYCAADLYDNNVYEAGDYMKSGDKTYFVCSKLCNARMKLHKQLHV